MKKPPKYRIVYKDSSGENFRVANVWESQFDGVLNLQPILEPNEEYNEMAFSEAVSLYADRQGFLNVYTVDGPKKSKPRRSKRRSRDDEDDDFE